MTKDEALRLAWDALQQIAHVSATDYEYQQWAVEAITAIKEALAQPEQEPVACVEYIPCCTDQTCSKCKAATQPQRTWVGLTDEEIVLIVADCASSHQHMDIQFAKAIEAKLKAKNS